jgi:renalase
MAASASSPPTVAVIGAGVAGLAAARLMRDAGCDVTVFEKSRGTGGRAATRRHDNSATFDHGCQYFTVRDLDFAAEVDQWAAENVVQIWDGRLVRIQRGQAPQPATPELRFIPVPAMSALGRHLSRGLELRLSTRVATITETTAGWALTSDKAENLGYFNSLIVAAPAPQTADLLTTAAPDLAQAARQAAFDPCWAVMAAFAGEVAPKHHFDAAFVAGSPLAFMAAEACRPGRPASSNYVLHASPAWSREHLEAAPETIPAPLLVEFFAVLGVEPREPTFAVAHRWRHAQVTRSAGRAALIDTGRRIAACGDWCIGPRLEAAWLSGRAAARGLVGR